VHYIRKKLNKENLKEKLNNNMETYIEVSNTLRYELLGGKFKMLSRLFNHYESLPDLYKRLLKIAEDIHVDICKLYDHKSKLVVKGGYGSKSLDLQNKEHNRILDNKLYELEGSKENSGKVVLALTESHKFLGEEIFVERLDSLERILEGAVKIVLGKL